MICNNIIPSKLFNSVSRDSELDCDCWSTNFIIDRLKQHLATVEQDFILGDGKSLKSRKYYDQAFSMQKIGMLRPVPPYVIKLSDLEYDPQLLSELRNLDKETLGYVLLQAVGRIFEDVNLELFHNSISRVLKVRLEK